MDELEEYQKKEFDIVNCAAKRIGDDLVDCLTPEYALICKNSLSFGSGYFCKHARCEEIIELTRASGHKGNGTAS